jgi:nitrogen fixation NifU-like protein
VTDDALYRQQVLQHAKSPIHFRRVEQATYTVPGHNPLCGDKLELYVSLSDTTVDDVSFQGTGCAISMASASMLAEMLSGAQRAQAAELVTGVNAMLASPVDTAVPEHLETLSVAALSEVRRYPSRVRCATLAWQAMAAALEGDTQRISTE